MKKVILCVIMILASLGVFAKKQVVYIEYFSFADNIEEARAEQIRAAIISRLTTFQHLQVVDVASQASLAVEKNRRSGEDALEDETARIGKMKQLGANYLIQGYISNFQTNEQRSINKKGETKIRYNSTLSYSLKVIDCLSGTLLSTDLFTYESGYCMNSEESIQKLVNKIPQDVRSIVTKNFKLRSIVLDSDYVSNKGNLVKCYINLGEFDGVTPGTIFAVKKATIQVGRVSWIEIGELVVENVLAGDLALCKVKRGAKEIYVALEEVISIKEIDPNNAHDLIVESKQFK